MSNAGQHGAHWLSGRAVPKQWVKAQALVVAHADHGAWHIVAFLAGEMNRRILADEAAADEIALIANSPASSIVLADKKMIQRLRRLFRLNGACHRG
nr:hypothetical protein SHINE37_41300 [Rhizobiaceae bacterium]